MLDWLESELTELRQSGLYRDRKVIRQLPAGWCEWNGRRLKNFAGNDYLNLAHDPRVLAAAAQSLETDGAGSTASQLVCGRGPAHLALEQELCDWLRAEAALLFPTGYAANLGAIAGLAGKPDVLFSDSLNHASLIDGCRLSGAKIVVYPHNDLTTLQSFLKVHPARRQFIVTDSVFSMDGDAADLRSLSELAETSGATLIVDEAHALGTLGSTGGGLVEDSGINFNSHVRVGTLSKAVGSLGGFVVGSQHLIDWLWNRARSQIFSTTLPPSACAAAQAAIRILRQEPQRRESLVSLSRILADGLRAAGHAIPALDGSPVIPVILNDPFLAVGVAQQLADRGFLVGAIRPPSVPPGTSRLRITLSSGHTPDEVQNLLTAILEILR